jgi:hypothetical protein
MNPEIVNIYIARLIKEIEDLTKNRILVETQLQYTEKLNGDFQLKINQLEEQIEKNNKKASKKEVNTSDTF